MTYKIIFHNTSPFFAMQILTGATTTIEASVKLKFIPYA